MGIRAAASLLKGAGRASGRFVAEVAVSFVATLCVTLVLSGWFRPATSFVLPDVTPPGAATPIIAAHPTAGDFLGAIKSSADAKSAIVDASTNSLVLSEKDATEKKGPPAIKVMEEAPLVAAGSSRNRGSHIAKVVPHSGPPSGRGTGEAATKGVNLAPPYRQAGADPQAELLPAVTAEEEHRPTVFGLALPSVPTHGMLVRPLRPVIQGASSVTEALVGLAGIR